MPIAIKQKSLDDWMFYLLCLFSLMLGISVAGANIPLSILCPLFLYRLYRDPPNRNRLRELDHGFFMTFGAFMIATVLSWIFSDAPAKGFPFFINHYGFRLIPFFTVLFWFRDKKRLWTLAFLLVISISITNMISIVQELHFMLTSAAKYTSRFSGFINIMAHAGLLSAAVPIFFLATIFRRKLQWPWAPPILLFIGILALICNGTRGAWLAAAATIVALFFLLLPSLKQKKTVILSLCGVLLLSCSLFLFSPFLAHRLTSITDMNTHSNSERLYAWTGAYHMFLDHPVFGVGLAEYAHAYRTKYILPEATMSLGHAHSNVMQMLGERGALGGLTFIAFWIYCMVFSVRGWKRTQQSVYLAFFAVVLGVMLQGLTECNLLTVVVSKAFWYSSAICLQWIALTEHPSSRSLS